MFYILHTPVYAAAARIQCTLLLRVVRLRDGLDSLGWPAQQLVYAVVHPGTATRRTASSTACLRGGGPYATSSPPLSAYWSFCRVVASTSPSGQLSSGIRGGHSGTTSSRPPVPPRAKGLRRGGLSSALLLLLHPSHCAQTANKIQQGQLGHGQEAAPAGGGTDAVSPRSSGAITGSDDGQSPAESASPSRTSNCHRAGSAAGHWRF